MMDEQASRRELWAALPAPSLYYIHTVELLDRRGIADCYRCISAVVQGGCRIAQLRYKGAWSPEVVELGAHFIHDFDGSDCLLLLNNQAEWARAIGAHGVHVGLSRGDTAPHLARQIIGREAILGVTAKTPEARAAAIAVGADYVSWGALFPSTTKPEAIPGALEEIGSIKRALPAGMRLCAIGGIDVTTIARVAREGPDLIAAGAALQLAADVELETIKLIDALRIAREVTS